MLCVYSLQCGVLVLLRAKHLLRCSGDRTLRESTERLRAGFHSGPRIPFSSQLLFFMSRVPCGFSPGRVDYVLAKDSSDPRGAVNNLSVYVGLTAAQKVKLCSLKSIQGHHLLRLVCARAGVWTLLLGVKVLPGFYFAFSWIFTN